MKSNNLVNQEFYETLLLRKAQVIDIDDPDEKGKIKIKILPDFKNISDDLLPWASPFSSKNSTSIRSNDLPEEGSIIRVLVREDNQRYYYLDNMYFYNLFDFSIIKSSLENVEEISDTTYKNIIFRLYFDGSLEFHNNSTGEHGFIHKSGSYFFFDSDGYFIISDTKNKIISGSSSLIINDNFEVLQ